MGESMHIEPLVHVLETRDEVIITADLPYAEKESIEIKAGGRKIEIFAECKKLGYASFYSSISLPCDIELSRAKAKFRRGILEIRLPKKKGIAIEIE